jgi:hypothetical protein
LNEIKVVEDGLLQVRSRVSYASFIENGWHGRLPWGLSYTDINTRLLRSCKCEHKAVAPPFSPARPSCMLNP